MLGESSTATLLVIGAHVNDFDIAKVEFQALSQTVQAVGIAQKNRLADAFGLGLYGSFHHCGVTTFGKYHALRMQTGCVVQLACEFRLLSEQLHEALFVGIPIGYGTTGDTTFDGSFGHSGAHFGDKTWVDRFRNEIFRTK